MLDLSDLFILAMLGQRLRELIVYQFFIRKYRLHKTEVVLDSGHDFAMYYKTSDNNYMPIVTDCKDKGVMVVLRYFGHLFTDVTLLNVKMSFESAANMHLKSIFCKKENLLRLDTSFPRIKLITDREGDLKYRHPYLTALNELLPSLEKLSIIFRHPYAHTVRPYETVRFKKVKCFAMKVEFHYLVFSIAVIRQVIESFQFDHLESFSVNWTTYTTQSMIMELILRNPRLKHIRIDSGFSLQQMRTVTGLLLELKEVTIDWNKETSPDLLSRFLMHISEINSPIEKCTVGFYDSDNSDSFPVPSSV